MCSASQVDLQHQHRHGEASSFTFSDTTAWHLDESNFNPSKGLHPSIVAPSSSTTEFSESYPWPEDEINEKEGTVRDVFYLSDASHNFVPSTVVSSSFADVGTMVPPSLVHESSSSSNPDTHSSYTHNLGTLPTIPNTPNFHIKREQDEEEGGETESRVVTENQQVGGNRRTLTYRERNRIAAQKCRKKSRQNVQELQQQERNLAEQNRYLNAHVDHLKNEVLGLRNEILNHGNCNDELIQNYITERARKLRS